MGIVQEANQTTVSAPVVETEAVTATQVTASKSPSGELDIKFFNDIADKMSRGIAKKAFMAAKRAEKDATGILADVAQALSDGGKMTGDIQFILDELSVPPLETVAASGEAGGSTKAKSVAEVPQTAEVKGFDIKI